MKLLSHHPSHLRSHGSPVKFAVAGKGETKPPFLKEKKEDLGNYRPVSLTWQDNREDPPGKYVKGHRKQGGDR